MSSNFTIGETSLAPKPKAPEELSKEHASAALEFAAFSRTNRHEIKQGVSGGSWQPSTGIWGPLQSSLPFRITRQDSLSADAPPSPPLEPKQGTDSGYVSLRSNNSDVPYREASRLSRAPEIILHQLRYSYLQEQTSSPALSWSADIPFNCYMCSASFKYSSDLSRHQASHSPASHPQRASGDSEYELAQKIPQDGYVHNVPLVQEQVIPPLVTQNSFIVSQSTSQAIQEALRNQVGDIYISVQSDEGWARQGDSQHLSGENLQLMGQTIQTCASTPHNAESSKPLSVEVDTSSLSDEETDWGDDSEDSFAQYSASYPRFVDDSTGEMSNQVSVIELVLSPAKQAVVDRLMTEFWAIFNTETRGAASTGTNFIVPSNNLARSNSSSQAGGDAPPSFASSQSNSASSRNTSISPSHEKQKRSEDGKDQEEDDGRDPKRRRTLLSPPLDPKDGPKFACPYRKHEPQKYCGNIKKWRSCAMTPLTSIARVKGHLYRHHRIFPCPRCKVLFQSQEEVTLHLGKPESCEFRDSKQEDGITSEVVERLRCKKKTRKGQSEEESWMEIYQLIFPCESVPSPYFEPPNTSEELSDYEEYCRRELPRVFRAALEEVVHNDTQAIEYRLRSQLERMITQCQDRVFSSYRSGRVSRSQTPLPPIDTDIQSQRSTYVQESLLADTSRVVGHVNDNPVLSEEIGTGVNSSMHAPDGSGYPSDSSALAPSLQGSEIIPTDNSPVGPTVGAEADAPAAIRTSMFNTPPAPDPESQQDRTIEEASRQNLDNSSLLGYDFTELDLIDWAAYLAAPDTS